ncbi:peptidoglycan binding domain-containing protein [Mediterraneibacter glycyrrhizinilyticus]|uniref:L,D-transpeptidase family protein n=1 Tax=Mediterraneibacter glycyrrhizinilyticus TaxID=342942 RepID=UPI0025AAD585|nr:peptidoglycan binding domain-containing protein [Mediterraneibacter glycyrrhizinilyticus]MDN0062389.1 peptidoglycan binding domain-containing protein [Mediterraneibacter glycyrrhizinilyticus]
MSRKRRHQSEKHQENINITDENAFEDISGEEQTEEEVPDEYEEAEDEQDDTVKNTGDEDIRSRKKVKRRRRGARKGVKKQAKKSMGKKPWIIAGSIIGALVVIYLGIAAFFMSHFLVNTSINGKDFSGKTVADVEAYLKEQVADYELTILEQNNVSDVITGSEISLAYKENSRVQDALENQRQLLWLISLFSESDTDITIEVEYDDAALEENIQNLQAVTAEQVDPVAAHPEYDGNSFVVAEEQYGTTVDMETLTAKIKEHITEFDTTLDMMDEECYVMPAYTSDSPEVQAACDEMNEYLKASITYPMDEDVVVDKDLISKWVTYDDDMKVTFNEDAVREWMREFGKKYDTLGTTRTITTPTGKTAEVSGGTYGWSVDEETETKNLINSIKNGEVAERAPAYKQTAASHGAQDWGSTYIEVDIAAQHMWYIVDGAVAMESDVVTGLPADGRDTPTGVYSILYTERDSTLKGETNPETGKPSYETPVAFWMPFTWQGHGFHDATWQSSFGGSRYQTNGSHGCVNMPYDKAEQLFNMISAGTPVIIHN